MKLLDRYILKYFGVTLASTLVVMIGLYLLLHFFSHVRDLPDAAFSTEGYSVFTGMCTYYAVHLPFILVLMGPYAVLISGMYTIHHLNQNNEITPMYAVGVGRLRVCLPLFLTAMALALLLVGMRESVVPGLSRDMERLHRLLKGQEDWTYEDVPLLVDSQGNVFHVQSSWDGKAQVLNDVFIQGKTDSTPVYVGDLRWNSSFETGSWESVINATPAITTLLHETDLTPHDIETGRSKFRLSFTQLRDLVRKRPDRKDLAVLMHTHITYAFTPLILLLMGLPLVMRSRQHNVFLGLGLCLTLSLAFFATTQLMQHMGSHGAILNPLLGAWLPVVMGGALGLILFEGVGTG